MYLPGVYTERCADSTGQRPCRCLAVQLQAVFNLGPAELLDAQRDVGRALDGGIHPQPDNGERGSRWHVGPMESHSAAVDAALCTIGQRAAAW